MGRLRLLRRPGLTLTPRAGPVRRGALPFTGQAASTKLAARYEATVQLTLIRQTL
ncbi:hypothetical protein P6B95_26270 [Streptomyces atratus]|uniref:hypothetical protein n=1 Tax=Streptomyces atratus TaxID=1893 RepID=UPI002AC33FED|nr:hypothetical protein [Streptomyces atratus]WPW33782.1 hypothetical protein P6B95_26270 [Streptomyces atratus]